jgi:FKBP-type peptidyl-prolyl cis-trans isomerase FkpA
MSEKVAIAWILGFSLMIFNVAWYANTKKSNSLVQPMTTVSKNTIEKSVLNVVDTKPGSGIEAVPGKTVSVQYTGKLADGSVFDSSSKSGAPLSFTLGAGNVIQGWEIGVAGMKVGGKRTLTIPPELCYGNQIVGPIPANATLTVDIELIDVR